MSELKQTVNGDVGNVVSGDVTINNYAGDISSTAQQPISLLQKRDLHKLMDELVEAGESKREMWLMLHTKLNTTTVNEMTAADYHCAVGILQECARRIKYLKDCNILVAKIISITGQEYRIERDRYCLKRFGTTHLKGMTKEQLQEIFGYFDDLLNNCEYGRTEPLQQGAATEPIKATLSTKTALWSGVVITIVAVFAGFMGISDKLPSVKDDTQNEAKLFAVETSNGVINASIPALRSIFPGLNKYKNDLISLSTYKQKSGWHTLKFTVSPQSSAPDAYAVKGKVCYINISPDGGYSRVLSTPCRLLLLDQHNVPDEKYRFILR
ncbi:MULTISPECIES: hypothetical protein [unclassified Serratia (in: enterobacteria)]|uniref:hypothetical protein n=1 Tax=unclassified Serratia (in: enterobacteria) TaxID=2647522 RepID=UPI000508AB03|nr:MULTISPECIES: hypothetical protein [unclassified Serratia (in: enterobacteria)]KFK92773.1 hypothetical protein JV45_19365 [Serratia sp. Ag2]KFK98559.1 hypothetical protein IV04_11925 [Serratia sp. Ag1]